MSESSLAIAIIELLQKMSSWEIEVIIAILFIFPPVLAFFAVLSGVRALRALERQIAVSDDQTNKVFVELVKRGEFASDVVKNYEKLVVNHQALADELLDVVKANTQAMTLSNARIESLLRSHLI
ncbi:MAG: hypothetical protein Q4G66_07785 [bacterium]|nr:hypothetical protein [bacterium]